MQLKNYANFNYISNTKYINACNVYNVYIKTTK